jgi:hypothetical protein
VSRHAERQPLLSLFLSLQARRLELHSFDQELQEKFMDRQEMFLSLHSRLLSRPSLFQELHSRSQERQENFLELHSRDQERHSPDVKGRTVHPVVDDQTAPRARCLPRPRDEDEAPARVDAMEHRILIVVTRDDEVRVRVFSSMLVPLSAPLSSGTERLVGRRRSPRLEQERGFSR